MRLRFAVIDDDPLALEALKRDLTSLFPDCVCLEFSNAAGFLRFLDSDAHADVFIIDAFLDDGDDPAGLELVRQVKKIYPGSPVFVRSWSDDRVVISNALKGGAADFVAKDASLSTLGAVVTAAVSAIPPAVIEVKNPEVAAVGATMRGIRDRVPRIIRSAVNCVYIEGESGVGKEVVSDFFQSAVPSSVPFVKVNCAAISPQLIMSELFGHEKGAFTGAVASRAGLIESCSGGWLFLDEVALLAADAQAALLRAIDNQVIRRVGGTKEIEVSFRVISATNESLSKKVADGTFRRDLWQRLCESEIIIPPLRERRAEVGELVDYFCVTMRGGPYTLAPRVRDILLAYDWHKGNVRELRNTLRSMTEKSLGRELTPASVPANIWNEFERARSLESGVDFLRLTWTESKMPDYDLLAKKLLWEMIRRITADSGCMSVRSLARETGIAKSTLPSKLQGLVASGVVSAEELRKRVEFSV